MSQAAYVAVDWGTSSFRLWLVDRAGNVLGERRSHEGMIAAGKLGFATVLQSHLEAVGAAHELPVIVCGMAGARQGWVEAGYVDTPAPLTSILKHAVRFRHRTATSGSFQESRSETRRRQMSCGAKKPSCSVPWVQTRLTTRSSACRAPIRSGSG